jgi:hypothetical protein
VESLAIISWLEKSRDKTAAFATRQAKIGDRSTNSFSNDGTAVNLEEVYLQLTDTAATLLTPPLGPFHHIAACGRFNSSLTNALNSTPTSPRPTSANSAARLTPKPANAPHG